MTTSSKAIWRDCVPPLSGSCVRPWCGESGCRRRQKRRPMQRGLSNWSGKLRSLNQLSVLSKNRCDSTNVWLGPPCAKACQKSLTNWFLRYGDLMDKALEQRAYKVEHDISERLRAIAEQIGFLKAGTARCRGDSHHHPERKDPRGDSREGGCLC